MTTETAAVSPRSKLASQQGERGERGCHLHTVVLEAKEPRTDGKERGNLGNNNSNNDDNSNIVIIPIIMMMIIMFIIVHYFFIIIII